MESKIIRSFFAIPVSSDCKQKINKIILNLKRDLPSVIRWVNTDNLHLTLKFLGEFNSEYIPQVKRMLMPVLSSSVQFDLTFQNLGIFPNEQKPKVVWIGINFPNKLAKIFQEIENAAFKLGYPKEDRGFSPHITIGRVKNDASDLLKIGALINKKKVGEISQSHVERVIFYQSNLTSTGPIYSELFHLSLKE